MSAPIVLTTGGTGGHMFPAEALARELIARGRKVALLTDRRGQAFGDRVPGVALHPVRAGRMGAGLVSKAVGLASIALGTLEARRALRRIGAAGVVGFGGYASVPAMLAAVQIGLPTVLHEQNAVLGRANRLLAPRARRIATSFAEPAGLRAADRPRAILTGNPVRPAVALLRLEPYAAPAEDGPFELLAVGGSQGARVLSDLVPAALALLPPELRRRIRLAQQARAEDLERVRGAYGAAGIAAELQSFFEDMPARLARAHLVIARAGASTIAELTIAGRPALLIPYPHAADDHQTANARAVAAAGGGWVLPQTGLTSAVLAERLAGLAARPADLARAAAAARALGRPDAARHLADLVQATFGADGAHTLAGAAA